MLQINLLLSLLTSIPFHKVGCSLRRGRLTVESGGDVAAAYGLFLRLLMRTLSLWDGIFTFQGLSVEAVKEERKCVIGGFLNQTKVFRAFKGAL